MRKVQLNLELEQLARLLALRTGRTPDAILKEAREARARDAGIALPDRATHGRLAGAGCAHARPDCRLR